MPQGPQQITDAEAQRQAADADAEAQRLAAKAEALRLQTFGPDKILGPEYAEHIQSVVIRAISQHVELGIVRERIADAVAEALTGKQMGPENSQGPKSFSEMLWEP
jgi:hypothetical protein